MFCVFFYPNNKKNHVQMLQKIKYQSMLIIFFYASVINTTCLLFN